jgi:oxygen-independent coproporphyrinogen-3 oxidase
LRGLGFNRVSLGVQDFAPTVQRLINRVQPFEMTRRLIEKCRALEYHSVNVDLIYGLPAQTETTFQHTLDTVAWLKPDRIALFSFAYVPWMKPNQKKIPHGLLPPAHVKFNLFARAIRTFTKAGYRQIGMDHFALAGDELSRAVERRSLSRNFQGYTVLPSNDIVGLGLTAIGDVAGAYSQNAKKMKDYLAAIDAGRLPVERGVACTGEDLLRRHVINSIMCNFAVDVGDVERRFGVDFERHFARERERLEPLERDGFVVWNGRVMELTRLGQLFVRNVAMVFDEYLERGHAADAPRFSRTV